MAIKEIERNSTASKRVYFWEDDEEGLEWRIKEVSKTADRIITFPFDTRKHEQRYDSIEKIVFEGFNRKIPSGFNKSFTWGYGFSRHLSPLAYRIQYLFPKVKTFTVSKTAGSKFISESEVRFNIVDLDKIRKNIQSVRDNEKNEMETTLQNNLSALFPKKIDSITAKYQKGTLSRKFDEWNLQVEELSDLDVEALQNLNIEVLDKTIEIRYEKLLESKIAFDKILIEDIIIDFEKLLNRKNTSKKLEDDWQDFFRDYILFFNFGQIEKFEKQKVLGDNSTNIPDFILMNNMKNLDVFEIKTHLTQLLSYDSGRKNFYWTSEAAKAISQAENYIDSIVEQEDRVIRNIGRNYKIHEIEAVRPKVRIIASTKATIAGKNTSTIKGDKRTKLFRDYRRLNESLKNTEIILYDELLQSFKIYLDRLAVRKTS